MRQVEGTDYTQTFSLVVKSISVRLVLTIAVSRGWKLKQIGILRLKCFFLHGTLEERIVLSQPVGFIDKERPNDVCLIKRALYGLKRSSRMWYPATPSDLEDLINQSPDLPFYAVERAARLGRSLTKHGVSKYNLTGSEFSFDAGGRQVVLVPGQVEDDASIQSGTRDIATNAALLDAVRADFPDAFIVYKPHPDVEAGLRPGETPKTADLILQNATAEDALARCDHVATMTSLLGFEALLRDLPVTCYGLPFYAGWGLTDDRMSPPWRRIARPSIDQLTHAVLIGYPRYFDPRANKACPPEICVERLVSGDIPPPPKSNRILYRLQSIFARFAPLWRR